jgi:hypothetical protein
MIVRRWHATIAVVVLVAIVVQVIIAFRYRAVRTR